MLQVLYMLWFKNMDLKTRIAYTAHIIGTPTFFFVLSIAIVLFLILAGEIYDATLFLTALIAVSGLAGILKVIFRVARPMDAMFELSSFAFPSGHSAGIAFLMVGILYLVKGTVSDVLFWLIALLLLGIVAIVAMSRVILRVHTPFQVFVGLSIGYILSILIFMFPETVFAFIPWI